MLTILTNGDLRHLSGDTMRFYASLTARLHARSVPPVEYVDRSVSVSVIPMATGGADEGRLVLAASAVHCPAGRAALRRVGRIDFNHFGRFVGKHHFNLMPSDIEYRTIKPALLSDVSAWTFNRAASRTGHAFRAQSLDHHRAIVAANVSRGNMRPMLADTGGFSTGFGNPALRLFPAAGATFAATDDLLRAAGISFMAIKFRRQGVSGTIGKHNRHSYTAINPNGQAIVDGCFIDKATNTDLPAKCGSGHGQFADTAAQITGHAEPYPADLGQLYSPPSVVKPLNSDLAASEGKSVAHTFSFGLGEAAKASPRTLESPIKSLQGPLLGSLTNRTNEVELGAQGGKFARLVYVGQSVPSYGLIAPPMVAPLFKRQVPNQTAYSRKLRERHVLIWRRAKRKGVAAKHTLTYNDSVSLVNAAAQRITP